MILPLDLEVDSALVCAVADTATCLLLEATHCRLQEGFDSAGVGNRRSNQSLLLGIRTGEGEG